TPDGVIAQQLIGQVIAGNDLTITNSSGTFYVNENGVMITDLDLTVTTTDMKTRILISPTEGFKIQKNIGTQANPVWTDQIAMDSNGNATFKGNISIGSGNAI